MLETIKTTFRNGVFVPQSPVDFPEGAEVEISIESGKMPNTKIKKNLKEFLNRAGRREISKNAPRCFTREELHERS